MRKYSQKRTLSILGALLLAWKFIVELVHDLEGIDFVIHNKDELHTILNFYRTPTGIDLLALVGIGLIVASFFRDKQSVNNQDHIPSEITAPNITGASAVIRVNIDRKTFQLVEEAESPYEAAVIAFSHSSHGPTRSNSVRAQVEYTDIGSPSSLADPRIKAGYWLGREYQSVDFRPGDIWELVIALQVEGTRYAIDDPRRFLGDLKPMVQRLLTKSSYNLKVTLISADSGHVDCFYYCLELIPQLRVRQVSATGAPISAGDLLRPQTREPILRRVQHQVAVLWRNVFRALGKIWLVFPLHFDPRRGPAFFLTPVTAIICFGVGIYFKTAAGNPPWYVIALLGASLALGGLLASHYVRTSTRSTRDPLVRMMLDMIGTKIVEFGKAHGVPLRVNVMLTYRPGRFLFLRRHFKLWWEFGIESSQDRLIEFDIKKGVAGEAYSWGNTLLVNLEMPENRRDWGFSEQDLVRFRRLTAVWCFIVYELDKTGDLTGRKLGVINLTSSVSGAFQQLANDSEYLRLMEEFRDIVSRVVS
jgi:hypothetical protein